MAALQTVIGVLLIVCLHGVYGLKCAVCDSIIYNGCGYWYQHNSGFETDCGDGTCMINRGTYQGSPYYDRKCFNGDIDECETYDGFVWAPEFKMSSPICCNSTDLCNGATTSQQQGMLSQGILFVLTSALIMSLKEMIQ